MRAVGTYVKLCIAAAYNKLNAGITYVKLTPQVSYVKLQATTTYTKLCIAASYTLLGTSVQYVLLKAAAITGQFISYLELTDTVSPTDSAALSVTKSLSDDTFPVDEHATAFEKFLADIVTPVDALAGIVLTDEESDSVVIDDFPVADDPELTIGKNLSETTIASDAGVLLMQDYCDITYFLEDYVGTSRTF